MEPRARSRQYNPYNGIPNQNQSLYQNQNQDVNPDGGQEQRREENEAEEIHLNDGSEDQEEYDVDNSQEYLEIQSTRNARRSAPVTLLKITKTQLAIVLVCVVTCVILVVYNKHQNIDFQDKLLSTVDKLKSTIQTDENQIRILSFAIENLSNTTLEHLNEISKIPSALNNVTHKLQDQENLINSLQSAMIKNANTIQEQGNAISKIPSALNNITDKIQDQGSSLNILQSAVIKNTNTIQEQGNAINQLETKRGDQNKNKENNNNVKKNVSDNKDKNAGKDVPKIENSVSKSSIPASDKTFAVLSFLIIAKMIFFSVVMHL